MPVSDSIFAAGGHVRAVRADDAQAAQRLPAAPLPSTTAQAAVGETVAASGAGGIEEGAQAAVEKAAEENAERKVSDLENRVAALVAHVSATPTPPPVPKLRLPPAPPPRPPPPSGDASQAQRVAEIRRGWHAMDDHYVKKADGAWAEEELLRLERYKDFETQQEWNYDPVTHEWAWA